MMKTDILLTKYDITSKRQNVSSVLPHETFTIKKDQPPENLNENVPSLIVSTIENDLVSECESEKEKIEYLKDSKKDIEDKPSLAPKTSSSSADNSHVSSQDIVIWERSNIASSLGCRGWMRSEEEWVRRSDLKIKKRDPDLLHCAKDNKFRTRLCNHWDVSQGTFCPMKKKNKCIFAHGPFELRVKETKRNRWGTFVDKNGNNSNPLHSGGEDTYGAARSIEKARKQEGKWNTERTPKAKGGRQRKRK